MDSVLPSAIPRVHSNSNEDHFHATERPRGLGLTQHHVGELQKEGFDEASVVLSVFCWFSRPTVAGKKQKGGKVTAKLEEMKGREPGVVGVGEDGGGKEHP